MTERDDLIAAIRPELAVDATKSGALETFPNETLRPILKLQNPLLVERYRFYVKKFNKPFNAFGQDAQKAYIHESVMKDIGLKNVLVSFVTGLLTVNEYRFYLEHHPQLKKRIVTMLVSRLQSQLERFY